MPTGTPGEGPQDQTAGGYGPTPVSRQEQVQRWVAAQLGGAGEGVRMGRHYEAADDSGHACRGELTVDSYFDTDGLEHIVVGTWYECEGLWEIEDDLILLT